MARLCMSLLGALQITLDDQPISKFGSINAQGLLIYLALHASQPVSREVLAALFWPEEPESRARANLRQNLHQLRKLLGDIDDPGSPFLLVERHAVQFNPGSDYVLDVTEFLAAIEDQDLEKAVTLYQGDLLPGFTCDSAQFEAWLRQERESLHRLALVAMHEQAQDLLGANQPQKAGSIAQRQLTLEPWRESAFRQLMQAYALAGDRANALAQYDLCRATLHEELRIAPEAETTALYEEIKSGRFGAVVSTQEIAPPPEKHHNLSVGITPLIGRESDLAQITALLTRDKQRLVTIVGPGGMGKTVLALAAGRTLLNSYPDGVYFADLAPIEQATEIPTAISAALQFQAPDRSQDIYPHLLAMLKQHELLLILDGFEHLLEGIKFVSDILQTCPNVSLLVTSRQRLNLAAESRYELGGLAYAETTSEPPQLQEALSYTAVQLFLDSGRRVRSDFVLDKNNLADVLHICRLVQGMPLGLLLAAAWLELLSPAEIAVEIETGLDFLAADLADLPERQRSMQAVFGRSWEMMTAQEGAVLARLSIFRGGFSRQAAEQVAGANLRILLALVNKSLVQRDAVNERFTLHELLRQFAAGKRQPEEAIGLLHCRYFAQIAGKEFRQALGPYPFHLARKLPHEFNNFRRALDYALEHGLAEEMLALNKAMHAYYFQLGIVTNAQDNAIEKQIIESLQRFDFAENHPVSLYIRLEDINHLEAYSLVRQRYLELLEEIKKQGDLELRYWAYARFALLDESHGHIDALTWSDGAVKSALAAGDEIMIKQAQAEALRVKISFGEQDESTLEKLRELLAFFEPDYPDSFVVYNLLWSLSAHAMATGDFEGALGAGIRCLNMTIGWHDLGWISNAEQNLANIHLQMGRPDMAARHQLDCLEWHLAIGERWQTIGFLYGTCINMPQLVGYNATAVSIMSFVYHHPEAFPNYRESIDEALPKFEQRLGSDAFATAWEKGRELDFETAVEMLRTALSQN